MEPVTLQKDAGGIEDMFDAIAPRYDLLNRVLSAGFDRRWRARAIGSLRLSGRETLLDVCTGTADVALAARQASSKARRVIGVDFAAAMIEIGRRKVDVAGERHAISLMRSDASWLPIADGCLDAVTMAFGIRNVEDPVTACREVHRVLRPGGRLAMLEFAIPTTPVLREAYLSYFTRVLPALGHLVSHHPSAYAYLPASVRAFPTPAQFVRVLGSVGFEAVTASRLTFGIVYLYSAVKR